jgi:hypothetical protein
MCCFSLGGECAAALTALGKRAMLNEALLKA